MTHHSNTQLELKGNWSDNAITKADEDRFGFRVYARVLVDRATETETPLTIGVFGRWGSGKTSLMHLMINEWKKRQSPELPTLEYIWINVWQLSNQEQLWNAFLQSLLSQVHNKLKWYQRLKFDWSLFRDRVSWWQLVRNLVTSSYRVVIVITPYLLSLLWPDQSVTDSADLLAYTLDPITGGGISIILGAWLLLRPAIETAKEKVSLDLGTILKKASYEAQISALQTLQAQFERMVRAWVGENGRLLIFIDDLDRCTHDKIPEILEAIKLFTTTDRCIYIIGLDHGIVRQSIKEKYKFKSDLEAGNYIEKVIQIPFDLPPIEDNHIVAFIKQNYTDLPQMLPVTLFASGIEPNPRKIKQVLNIYRTVLEIMVERVLENWYMLPVDPELLCKVIVIQQRFHDLYDHLIKSSEFLTLLETSLKEASKLEDIDTDIQNTLTGKSQEFQAALIDAASLPILLEILKTGQSSFKELVEDEVKTYIYLTDTFRGVTKQKEPHPRKQAFLSGNLERMEQAVIEFVASNKDPRHRQRHIQTDVDRLERILSNGQDYTDKERDSATKAINLLMLHFTKWLVDEWPDDECINVFYIGHGNNTEKVQQAVDDFIYLWRKKASQFSDLIQPIRLSKIVAIYYLYRELYDVLLEKPEALKELENYYFNDQADLSGPISQFVSYDELHQLLTLQNARADANFSELSENEVSLYMSISQDIFASDIMSVTEAEKRTATRRQTERKDINQVDLAKLFQVVDQSFNEGELRDLSFYLDLDYDLNLPGETKRDRARELIGYFDRAGRINELIELVLQQRPHISRDEVMQVNLSELQKLGIVQNDSSLERSEISRTIDRARLLEMIVDHFNIEELNELCYLLKIDFENLAGEHKRDKARELIIYLERRGRIDELFALLYEQRPNIGW